MYLRNARNTARLHAQVQMCLHKVYEGESPCMQERREQLRNAAAAACVFRLLRAHKMQIGAWCASLTPQNLSPVEILIKRRRALSELLSHISGASLFPEHYCKRDLKTLRDAAPQSAFWQWQAHMVIEGRFFFYWTRLATAPVGVASQTINSRVRNSPAPRELPINAAAAIKIIKQRAAALNQQINARLHAV